MFCCSGPVSELFLCNADDNGKDDEGESSKMGSVAELSRRRELLAINELSAFFSSSSTPPPPSFFFFSEQLDRNGEKTYVKKKTWSGEM